MRTPIGVIIFLSLMLLLDIYVFQSIKIVTNTSSVRTRNLVVFSYWTVVGLSVISFLLFVYTPQDFFGKKIRVYLFAMVIGFFLAKLLAATFFVIDDIRRIIQWIFSKAVASPSVTQSAEGDDLSRSVFLSWMGLIAGSSLFGTLVYGFGNKYNYKVVKHKLSFDNLPSSFKGLKIIHISDIHTGSLLDKEAVEKGIKMILEQKPDVVFFTGDLVNDRATEMEGYMELFSKITAPMGVYSSLGNHDYGDYVQWPQDGISKEQNLENLKKVHAELGWRLLLNEHIVLEKNNEKIAVLGVENWSSKIRFPKYGKLENAYKGSDAYPFKILLSHDPSHWDAQVRTDYNDIDLMLSGHTHGMQFGVEIPGIKWSPVQYVYKEWAGLYETGNNKLYVNRGFGFLGYPGRVGVMPEITVLELV
jgi:predicted MPP superfamily phosphohydrolase